MISKLAKTYLGATIPVINVTGVIHSKLTNSVAERLQQIQTSRAVALAVVVNSPGGLPVQSQIICEKIRNFADKHNLKLYTFARDVAASGGYMVLAEGDHVVADSSSIVGSIGVVFQKMKLKGLFDHFNLDFKSVTTNDKLMQNIFAPDRDLTPEEQTYLKQICERGHEKFIAEVKRQRGNKLKINDKIFSGEVFTGQQAKECGLVDEVGSMVEVLAARHPEARLQIAPEKSTFVRKVLGL